MLGLTSLGWEQFGSVTVDVDMTVLTAGRAPLDWHYEFDAAVVYEPATNIARAEVNFTQLDRESGQVRSEEQWQKVTAPENFFLLGYPSFETTCVAFPNEGLWPLDPSPNGLVPATELITAESFPHPVVLVGPGGEVAGQPTTHYRAPYALIGGLAVEANIWLWEGTDVVARLAWEDQFGNITRMRLVETGQAASLDVPSGCEPHGTQPAPQARRSDTLPF
jgi:hypothetical protein